MQQGDPYEFGFDESHDEFRDRTTWTCPICDGPLQAAQRETVCVDCGQTIESERGH